jgi:hypothetical protein
VLQQPRRHIELGFQLANGGGQGGLRHTAGGGSATEMPFPRKRNQIFKMVCRFRSIADSHSDALRTAFR